MEQLQRALHQDSAEQKGVVRVAAEHSHGAMLGEAEDESLTYGKWSMGYDQKSSRGRTAPSLCVQDAVHGALRLNICLADFFFGCLFGLFLSGYKHVPCACLAIASSKYVTCFGFYRGLLQPRELTLSLRQDFGLLR